MHRLETERLQNRLESLLGAESVKTSDPALNAVSLRGGWQNTPCAIVSPTAVEQIPDIICLAEEAGIAILPSGAGTKLHIGYPPTTEKTYLVLKTDLLNRITDYQPDDLTVTCEPGTSLGTVQNQLAHHTQFLALDVPLSSVATLGGVVSSGTTGFWRASYGAPRDLVIGMQVVMTGGKQVKGGGRVVKNVAGYDVCKLFTGAWGTLGVITELTFRLRTLPERDIAYVWEAPSLSIAAEAGFKIHHARLAPAYLLATNELDGKPALVIGLHGSEARTSWQKTEFAKMLRADGIATEARPLSAEESLSLRDKQARLDSETSLACQVALQPAMLANFLKQTESGSTQVTGHIATGLVSLASPQPDATLVRQWTTALPKDAHIIWTRFPAELERNEGISRWGTEREEFFLHRALKKAIDPQNTFSPHRFLGKI